MSMNSDWDFFVAPQSSSCFQKRSFVWVDSHEEMSDEGALVKALPTSRRRMMPPTPGKARTRRSRICSCQPWRYKEAAGMLVKERLLREWNGT